MFATLEKHSLGRRRKTAICGAICNSSELILGTPGRTNSARPRFAYPNIGQNMVPKMGPTLDPKLAHWSSILGRFVAQHGSSYGSIFDPQKK